MSITDRPERDRPQDKVLANGRVMRAVMRFAERVAVLVSGSKIADGAPEEVMSHPEVVKAYLGE